MKYSSKEQLVIEFKKLLLDNQISQREVAQRLNITPQALNKIMNKQNFGFDDMQKLLSAINYNMLVEFIPSSASTAAIDTHQEESLAAEPKAAETQTAHQEPPVTESENPRTPQKKPERKFKPFTESDAKKIDMARLPKDIKYQMDIIEVYGRDVLASLLDKARKENKES
ncbi:MAG: helix-turn-helix domain-containing protein [Lachnospiraceae bacterium]|nr:helix-turn-helix domain-containing protein [Lachnospiraceae bacterium]